MGLGGVTVAGASHESPVAEAAGGPRQWFAIWTRSQCESKVHEALLRKGLDVFWPCVRQASRRRDRRVVLDRALFPGYLFMRFAPSPGAYLRVVSTEGVARILGDRWDALCPIPDDEIEAVRRIVTTTNNAGALPWLRHGDRVRVITGPLRGLEGLVQECRPGRARFVVGIELLQRSVGVEVPEEILERI